MQHGDNRRKAYRRAEDLYRKSIEEVKDYAIFMTDPGNLVVSWNLGAERIITGKLRLEIQPVMLAPVVETAVSGLRPAAEAKGLRLDSSLDPAAGPVTGDPARLQQVVTNLLSNAVKFTPEGGRVEVRLGQTEARVRIVVRDTGVGISPEALPHIFERFHQADSSNGDYLLDVRQRIFRSPLPESAG